MTLYIDTRPKLLWVLGQATTEFGIYDIDYTLANGKIRAELIRVENEAGEPVFTSWFTEEVDTLDQAKAAAQADYEARTAERFRKVEVPMDPPFDNDLHTNMMHDYDTVIDALMEAILATYNPRSRGMIDSVTKAKEGL